MPITSSATMATETAHTTTTPATPDSSTKPAQSMRMKIAKQILMLHIILIVVSFLFFVGPGFDREEFTSLMGLLMPVTAIYAGVVFRFLGRSLTTPEPIKEPANDLQVNGIVKLLIYGHFASMLLLITTKALAPNILTFEAMTMALTLLESVIGAYMGSLMLALFEGKTS